MLTAKTFPTPRIGKPRKSCPICAVWASSRSIPRRTTRACAPIVVRRWPWRGGHICGISVAWRDDSGIRGNYFPLRHPDSQNFERENVARWLKDLIAAGVKFTTHERAL